MAQNQKGWTAFPVPIQYSPEVILRGKRKRSGTWQLRSGPFWTEKKILSFCRSLRRGKTPAASTDTINTGLKSQLSIKSFPIKSCSKEDKYLTKNIRLVWGDYSQSSKQMGSGAEMEPLWKGNGGTDRMAEDWGLVFWNTDRQAIRISQPLSNQELDCHMEWG